MSALASPPKTSPRRTKAANTVDKALRGGILAGAVAAVAWLLAATLSATVFFILIIATVLAVIYTVVRGDKARLGLWAFIGVSWVAVILERSIVNHHGGLWVGAAIWIGAISGARRAGISKRWMILLAYPVALGAACVAAGQNLLNPWGVSWLWVAALLGPLIGVRTLLNPSPRNHEPSPPAKRDPIADQLAE
jgi:hypothetical protein